MKLAIMQPYFFPYIGYFSLIYQSDKFIFFDTPQYTKKSWYERNRIIKLQGGTTYIKVPIEKIKFKTAINEVKIDNSTDWILRIFSQLEIYKKAPYYFTVINLLKEIFSEEYFNLARFNVVIIKKILNYLNIDREIFVFSEMELELGDINSPDEWALEISKKMRADVYINSPGGESFFDKEKYDQSGVKLTFIDQPLDPYKQIINGFEKGLSIIDVMMHNSKGDIVEMIKKSTFK